MIDSYKFGAIVIDGEAYTSDVIVFPGEVQPGWWRETGHSLSAEDLKTVFAFKPDRLVVGCGHNGMMTIPEATKKAIAGAGIRLTAMNTSEAVTAFNAIAGTEKAVGAFHLTC